MIVFWLVLGALIMLALIIAERIILALETIRNAPWPEPKVDITVVGDFDDFDAAVRQAVHAEIRRRTIERGGRA